MSAEHTLEIEALTLGYDAEPVIAGLSAAIPTGKVTVLIGANASGKSTLLRGIGRLLAPRSGRVLLDGISVHHHRSSEVAKLIGVLPQSPLAPDSITVADLVARGRHPHQGWFRRWSRADEAAVQEALLATGTLDLAGRRLAELSGGQRQRVWIAMVLAQGTDILLLDEPTTFLDLHYQLEVLDLLCDLNRERGTTIVMVLHELNLACRYADHLIALKAGSIVVQGRPNDVITAAVVEEVFGLSCDVIPDPRSGTPLVIPLGRHRIHPEGSSV